MVNNLQSLVIVAVLVVVLLGVIAGIAVDLLKGADDRLRISDVQSAERESRRRR